MIDPGLVIIAEGVAFTTLTILGSRWSRGGWRYALLAVLALIGAVGGYLRPPHPVSFAVHSSEASTAFPIWVGALSAPICGATVLAVRDSKLWVAWQAVLGVISYVVSNMILRLILFSYGI